MTEAPPLQQLDRTYVRVGRRRLSYFAGCDYFRLASHPKVLRALGDGLKRFGLNVAASRLTTGNHALYAELEKSLMNFFHRESAVLVANGYMTNLIVAQALAGSFSQVLIDEKAHSSLMDATRFFKCPVIKFKHRDPADLQRAISRTGKNTKPILFADGIFSHDGSLTPLKSYLKLFPADAMMMVDDAHGAGTLGRTGQGSIELEAIPRRRVIQTITLSKAFGVYGGAILGPRALREKIVTRSSMFGGSTPLPLPLANAALASINILRTDKKLRQRLVQNVAHVKSKLRESGWEIAPPPSPIVAIFPKSLRQAEKLKERCLANGVYPSFINYHGGPRDGYFRFAISSEHSRRQLDSLIAALIS
ncbi:MAG: pyridoxal phosphate-dependent aminotransferase family protein [Verrucomicrobiota bacterium]